MSIRDEGQTLSQLISSLGDQIQQQDIPEEGQREIQLVLKDSGDSWEVFVHRYSSTRVGMDVSTHGKYTKLEQFLCTALLLSVCFVNIIGLRSLI